ncbi:hypothetical protein O6H91_13G084700 [Diphasiastrum complanatum]|nr:hypothetical protein O6H91_13G084700 [Diphasiastrum complanatum]
MDLKKEQSSARGNLSGMEFSEEFVKSSQVELPTFMRFEGERLTLPLIHRSCERERVWIDGLSLVADQRFLPFNKPNPHHEAEKLIPATFLVQHYEAENITLYWFSQKEEVSDWANGFIKAVEMENSIKYVDLPRKHESPICFKDAIVLSAPTNVRYIPDQQRNEWLRRRVLQHCSIPIVNTSLSIEKAIILDRRNGPRHLANKLKVAEILYQALKVPVDIQLVGSGSFCHQVQKVTEGSLLLVPHGSQNVNLIFARPGAIVIEVFPFLFYNNALRNYTHAANVHIYPLLGVRPPGDILLWIFSLLGWDNCYYHVRLCKNYSRRQPIYVNLLELENFLTWIIKMVPMSLHFS